ncbi:MAG: hypothetical protein LQ344_006464 [Seirophora lacunosa]|nr:MAG: hypothetical protein LQ344_006464 [Seirophora lacunosa]
MSLPIEEPATNSNTLFLNLLARVPSSSKTTNTTHPPPLSSFTTAVANKPKMSNGMASGKTMKKWDDTADKNLLLQIIAGQDVRVDYGLVAPKFNCTPSAIKQRVLKLKNQAKEAGYAVGPDGAAAASGDGDGGKTEGNGSTASKKKELGKGKAPAAGKGSGKGKGEAKEPVTSEENETSAGAGAANGETMANKKRGRKTNKDEGKVAPANKKQKTATNAATAIKGKAAVAKGKKAAPATAREASPNVTSLAYSDPETITEGGASEEDKAGSAKPSTKI